MGTRAYCVKYEECQPPLSFFFFFFKKEGTFFSASEGVTVPSLFFFWRGG